MNLRTFRIQPLNRAGAIIVAKTMTIEGPIVTFRDGLNVTGFVHLAPGDRIIEETEKDPVPGATEAPDRGEAPAPIQPGAQAPGIFSPKDKTAKDYLTGAPAPQPTFQTPSVHAMSRDYMNANRGTLSAREEQQIYIFTDYLQRKMDEACKVNAKINAMMTEYKNAVGPHQTGWAREADSLRDRI